MDIQNGEIRHVTKNPDVIIKVVGPIDGETIDESGQVVTLDMYIQTNEFPKYHYIVILGLVDSYIASGHRFYIAKLITHSAGYDNFEITPDLYNNTTTAINLAGNRISYITRDKFLIPEAEVLTDKVHGHFYLDKLDEASEY